MYQQISIIGNVGRDPEMRLTNQGTAVTSFNVATNRSWTNANNELQTETIWFRVTTWGKQAESCNEYVKKGHRVLVVGEMKEPSTWTDDQGESRASLELTARTVKFLTPRDASLSEHDNPFNSPSAPAGAKNNIPDTSGIPL